MVDVETDGEVPGLEDSSMIALGAVFVRPGLKVGMVRPLQKIARQTLIHRACSTIDRKS
jgi:hypothetical protein